jgi:hypothetical protein
MFIPDYTYMLAQQLVESFPDSEWGPWYPGGAGGGGRYQIRLLGRIVFLRVANDRINELDALYEGSDVAERWGQMPPAPGQLKPDAPWLLIDLVNRLWQQQQQPHAA